MSKRCEECKNKQPSYGMPADNKQRWCQPCSTKHPGAVNLVGKKKVGKASANRSQPIPQPTPVAASHEPVAGVAVIAEKAPDMKRTVQQMQVPVPVERPPAKRQAMQGLQEPSPLTAHVAPMPPSMGPPAGLPPMTAPMASVATHTPLVQPMEFQGLAPPNPYGSTAIPSSLSIQPPRDLREQHTPHHDTVRAAAVATATIPDAIPANHMAIASPAALQPLQQPVPPSAEQLPSVSTPLPSAAVGAAVPKETAATGAAVGGLPAPQLQYQQHHMPPQQGQPQQQPQHSAQLHLQQQLQLQQTQQAAQHQLQLMVQEAHIPMSSRRYNRWLKGAGAKVNERQTIDGRQVH